MKDEVEMTKSGLEYLQVGAKKIALENIYQEREAALAKAKDEFQTGKA